MEIRDTTNLTATGKHTLIVTEDQTDPTWSGKAGDYFENGLAFPVNVDEGHEGVVAGVTLECEDPNEGPVQFSLRSSEPGKFGNIFRIRSTSGELEVIDSSSLNYARMERTQRILEVACIDSTGRETTGEVNVTVNDIPQPPEFQDVPLDPLIVIEESADVGTILAPVQAFDEDESSAYNLHFEVSLWGEFGSEAPISATPVAYEQEGALAFTNLTLTNVLDYNEKRKYYLNVSAIDETKLSDSVQYELEVEFVNTPPEFTERLFEITASEDINDDEPISKGFNFSDRTPIDRNVHYDFGVVSSDVPDLFTFRGSNLYLQSGRSVNFDLQPKHHLRIRVTDEDGYYNETDVTLFLDDVNDMVVHAFSDLPYETSGGQTVTFTGENFGPVWRNSSVSAELRSNDRAIVFPSSCWRDYNFTSELWDNTRIECAVPEGVGKRLHWLLKVDDHQVEEHTNSAYRAPSVDTIAKWPDFALTSGGHQFALLGTNFGPHSLNTSDNSFSSHVTVKYRNDIMEEFTSDNCAVNDHTTITCETVPGRGKGLEFKVVIGTNADWAQESSWVSPADVAYSSPKIHEVIKTVDSIPTAGTSDGVRLHGLNFGPPGFDLNVHMENQILSLALICPGDLHNHTVAVCSVPEGVGAGFRLSVETAGLASNLSAPEDSLGYIPPNVTEIVGSTAKTPSNLNTECGDMFFVRGANFGPQWDEQVPLEVHYGDELEYVAEDCVVVEPHTELECYTVPGVGKDLKWMVLIANHTSNVVTSSINYHPPIVATYQLSLDSPIGEGVHDLPTSGNDSVFVGGRYFGPPGTIPDLVTYGQGNESFMANDCEVTSDDVLVCQTAPGAGSEHIWTVSIGSQLSEASTTSYAPPVIHGFAGVNGSDPNSLSTEGGEEVDILGDNFGPKGQFLDLVTYGRRGTENQASSCRILEHTVLRCQVDEGFGTRHRWIVTIAGQSSSRSSTTTSYAPPRIFDISPDHGPTGFVNTQKSMPKVELLGRDFGRNVGERDFVSVLIDNKGKLSRLEEAGKINASEHALQHFLRIQQEFPDEFNELAVQEDEMQGESMISWLNDITVIGVDPTETSGAENKDGLQRIEFAVPEGFGEHRAIMVKVDKRISFPVWFDYDPPTISNVAPGAVVGATFDVVIDGLNFCADQSCDKSSCCGSVIVNSDVVSVPSSTYSHDQITVTLPDDPSKDSYDVQIKVFWIKTLALIRFSSVK